MLSKEELLGLIINNPEEFNKESVANELDLSEIDMTNLHLEGVVFNNVDLTSSSFADSVLTEVKFINCDMTSVDFNRATLTECVFNDSVLNGTDFSYSNTNYCNFNDSDLAGAIFMDADLSDSDFTMSENLNASRFDDSTIWPDSEYLPEDFDAVYLDDLSSLKDEEDYQISDY